MVRHRSFCGSALFMLLLVAGCQGTPSEPEPIPPTTNPPAADPTTDPSSEPKPTTATTDKPQIRPGCHGSYLSVKDNEESQRVVFAREVADPDVLVFTIAQPGPSTMDDADGTGVAIVKDERTTPHTLVLSSSGAAEWRVEARAPSAIRKLIVLGERTMPKVVAPAGVEIVKRDEVHDVMQVSLDVDRDPLLDPIRKIVGGPVHEVMTSSFGSALLVRDIPKEQCREWLPDVAVGSPMKWSGAFSAEKGSVTSATGDDILAVATDTPHTTHFVGRSRDRGKFYFEAELVTLGTASRNTSLGVSNAGVQLFGIGDGCGFQQTGGAFCSFDRASTATGSPSPMLVSPPYSVGARTGYAVDLEKGEMYMRVSDRWTPGDPGVVPGYAIARAPMAPVMDVGPGDQVRIVFAPSNMRFQPPAGFTAGW